MIHPPVVAAVVAVVGAVENSVVAAVVADIVDVVVAYYQQDFQTLQLLPPSEFSGRLLNYQESPDLASGMVEHIANQDYMFREPQLPTYLYMLDVSQKAVQSGCLRESVQGIKQALQRAVEDSEDSAVTGSGVVGIVT